jgi:HEPN domain-containing protein
VELLLKSLILLEKGDALQIHPLTDLYALLSVESKAAVENNFNAKAASSRILQAMKGKFPEISLNFHDVLAAVTRAFEKWRYAFDDSDLGGAHGLFELEAAIRERIATLAPNAA